jgi:GT2 family glycosyltransferase
MDPIPLIGALCLLRADLLKRLIKSIDYPVQHLVLLFQGKQLAFSIEDLANSNIMKLTLIRSSFNIGVSRGWNFIIKHYLTSYCLICGDDTFFESGCLQTISRFMQAEDKLRNVYLGMNLKERDRTVASGFSSFILTKASVEKIGLFDENIYPAYFEDDDYWVRIVLSGEKSECIPGAFIYSGDEQHASSLTLNSVCLEERIKMHTCYANNEKYYLQKWNERANRGIEKCFKFPFNNPHHKLDGIFKHPNYFKNQQILLNHRKRPAFEIVEYRLASKKGARKSGWRKN